MLGIINSTSQIIYHDLNPDVVFPVGSPPPNFSYNLDLDINGTSDLQISQSVAPFAPYTNFSIGVTPLNGKFISIGNNVDTLNFGDSISVTSMFYNAWGALMFKNYSPPYSTSGYWNNIENHFIGISFNSPSGLKYGWIRIGHMMTILDYAYNNSPNQPILAGEGLPNYIHSNELFDNSNFGDGKDLRIKFYKVFEETKTAGYKIIVVPSSHLSTFNIDSAKQVLNSNSLFIPSMNKNIDTVLNSTSKDVYGNLIVSLKRYNAFVLTLPDLVTTFDTLMSEVSNEITLINPNLPAQITTIISTKIPGSYYNLNLIFNPPMTETGILNYRLFFINEIDSTKFNIDTANSVSSLNYIAIPKTGTAQSITFQSNLMRTHLGNTLNSFMKYKAVLMSVTDTLNTNTSVLSNVSNSFTVYTQVQPVTEIIMSDVADNHNISDINAYFTKVVNESNILGYRGLIVPQNSLATFNLDSANASLNYMTYNKNGQNQNAQLQASLNDIHGNAIQESQTYHFFVLTMNDNNFSDVNALSATSKYFEYTTPDCFEAGSQNITSVLYSIINDTIEGIKNYPSAHYYLDVDTNGVNDLDFVCNVVGGVPGANKVVTVTPLNQWQLNTVTPFSNFITAHDSADMIFNELNWNSTTDTIKYRSYYSGGPYNYNIIKGDWDYDLKKFMAIRLIGVDTLYAWVKLSVSEANNNSIRLIIDSYGLQNKNSDVGLRNNESNKFDLILYPNPASEYVHISFNKAEMIKYNMELMGIEGKVILSKSITNNDYTLGTSDLAKGIYCLRFINEDGASKVFKLVIQ